MSFFGARFSSAVTQLRGELSAAPQTANDTILRLVEKINTSAAVDDRRTAVLGLKGLSRDWRADVGRDAFPSLLAVLKHDAPYDVDIAKAVLETLMVLCEVPEKKDDVGLRNIDAFLETEDPFHSVVGLISNSPAFFPRFYSLQFLSQIVTARAPLAQSYVLSAPPPGIDGVLAVLDPKAPAPAGGSGMGGGAGEMLRNEALLLLPALLAGNADLQKIVAFSGAFEMLLNIISAEGGIEGGIVVQDALTVMGTLLRFNVSNQNLFRELSLIPGLPPILHFPTPLAADEPAPDAFALQDWPEQKLINAGLVLGLVRMLIGGPGGNNQSAMAIGGVTRALLELSLASNAPNGLKCQALNTLTPLMLSSAPNQSLLSTLMISPLVPVEADYEHPQGGFIRLPPRPAAVALAAAVIEGDPSAGGRGLRGRAAGVNMFEAFVTGNDDARIGILGSMVPPPEDNPNSNYPDIPQTAGSLIVSGLLDLPTAGQPFDPYRPLFSCLLLAHLLRNSEQCKKLAREITFPSGDEDGDEDRVSLLQLIVGNLMMASREHTDAVNRAAKDGLDTAEDEDWTRVMVGYLVLLSTWLWDSPKSVKEFLSESANLQVLIGPITQPTGIDPLVQGLCAFLLGVCYEYNREPGEITRSTLHPILHSRIGPDQFVSRMARLREDPRFRAVQPDAFDTEGEDATTTVHESPEDNTLELWFDWAFVDFWKNNYYTIQRAIAVDPDAVRGTIPAGEDGESGEIIASLREKLAKQATEVQSLQAKLESMASDHAKELAGLRAQITTLNDEAAGSKSASTDADAAHAKELESLRAELASARDAASEKDKEAAAHAETRSELETARADLESARSELDLAKRATASAKKRVEELEKGGGGGGGKGKKGKGGGGGGGGGGDDERVKKLEAELAAEKEKSAKAEQLEKDLAAEKAKSEASGEAASKLEQLEKDLAAEKERATDAAKEQEDLLVLLEELTQKRRADKKLMREKGMDVSDDEDEDDEEEDDE